MCVMSEPFEQPKTIHVGKYILANDVVSSLVWSQRAPARTLSVSEFCDQCTDSFRLVQVNAPVCVESFRFDSWTEKLQFSTSELPKREIPSTSVLVVPSGRVVGRYGDVDVPMQDVRIRQSKSSLQEAAWFAQTIRFGKLNPRFWKRVALNSLHKRFVPAVSRCYGRVAVLNCAGSHNYFH